jgi:hypothetical protein
MKKKIEPDKTVQPIHFEDLAGNDFERLSFAHILNIKEWYSIDWYGQSGSDGGRDIWAVDRNDFGIDKTYCYQCANYQSFNFSKAKDDIDKIIKGTNSIPDNFVLIAGGKVSAKMKERIVAYAKSKGIKSTQIWSGPEFEEMLRKRTPSLIRRFCEGEEFPESTPDLKLFAVETAKNTDQEILSLMAQCFDRPAFKTPFAGESDVPAFKQAITDTIEVLNTGVHRLRDGTVIRRIPSRHNIQDKLTKKVLASITNKLIDLRSTYDDLITKGEIEPCSCGLPICSMLMSSPTAGKAMDQLRNEILTLFRSIYPDLDASIREYLI